MSDNKKLDYASAGVDIAAGDEAVERIKKLAKATFNDSVLSEIGSFGGFFKPDLSGIKKPVLISSADGVGTKLKIAFMKGQYNTVGECLVNHCTDDILVHGAKPLFFLDYIATGKLKPDVIADIVEGFSRGCKNNGMALLGGETAEMPDFYQPGEFDLAGFIVGMVDQDKIINGSTIKEGDVVVGLKADGLHTNGYSLARKLFFEIAGFKHDTMVDELGMTAADALLIVHKSYLHPVQAVLEKYAVHGMAHITGGGIPGNLVRIIPDGLRAVIDLGTWDVLPIFKFMQAKGKISDKAMFEAFNMGIGYILVVPNNETDKIVECLKGSGETPYIIGKIEKGEKAVILK
ncbi:MAG: phosphoribosylformylglycinamidine cyclo-ligase [Candidatus Zixiibacteriota bacterium]